jgi:hypothetical protein
MIYFLIQLDDIIKLLDHAYVTVYLKMVNDFILYWLILGDKRINNNYAS